MTFRSTHSAAADTAVVFLSHRTAPAVRNRFSTLVADTPSSHDVYFLYDATNATAEDERTVRDLAGDQLRTFVHADIVPDAYPNPWIDPTRKQLIPGNTDLLFLHFSQLEPGYACYWFIEYDVAYTGSWTTFFEAAGRSSAALLGTTLYPYTRRPEWYWWPTFDPSIDLPRSEWLCGFFPIVRLSDELLGRLHEAYLAGWSGHVEAVLPTLARYHDLPIEDLGGDGPYVPPGHTNRFYTNSPERGRLSPGTFVYRPVRARPGRTVDMLWHPVKPNRSTLRAYARRFADWLAARRPAP